MWTHQTYTHHQKPRLRRAPLICFLSLPRVIVVTLVIQETKSRWQNIFTGFQSWRKLCRYMYTYYLNLTVNYCMKLNHYTDKCLNTKTCSQHLPEQLWGEKTGTYIQESYTNVWHQNCYRSPLPYKSNRRQDPQLKSERTSMQGTAIMPHLHLTCDVVALVKPWLSKNRASGPGIDRARQALLVSCQDKKGQMKWERTYKISCLCIEASPLLLESICNFSDHWHSHR